MSDFKTGDIVKVHYPFIPPPVEEDAKTGKCRYGMIINTGKNGTVALPILQISSHGGKTERPGYRLRDDEVRVPDGLSYYKKSQNTVVSIHGVIKTEQIAYFDDDDISRRLTNVGLDAKKQVLGSYKSISNNPYYVRMMDNHSPNHVIAMEKFEEAIIAEELGFLETRLGIHQYEEKQDDILKVNKIQSLGASEGDKRIHFYAVELKDEENEDSFFYTFATMKKKNQIAKEWGKPRTAEEWLKEDERYYRLKKDINTRFNEPLPNMHKYQSFALFRRNTLENSLQR